MESSKKPNQILILIILVVVLVIAVIAFGNKGGYSQTTSNERPDVVTEEGDQMPPLSESTDTTSIEADLESTNFSELDAELK